MTEKINVYRIVQDHFRTLRDYGTGAYSKGDIFIFFVVPALVAAAAVAFGLNVPRAIGTLLVTALSIFGALLFNLLLLLYDIVRRAESGPQKAELRLHFLRQLYSNISFSILLAVLTLVVLLVSFLGLGPTWVGGTLDFLTCYLAALFLLTLFMVLKRMHILLSMEFDTDRD